MGPDSDSDYLKIPLTLDTSSGRGLDKNKKAWGVIIFLIWVLTLFIAVLLTNSFMSYLTYGIVSLFFVSLIIRFVILRERYFMKKRQELLDSDFLFDNKLMWNIVEIGAGRTPVIYYGGTLKGVAVSFEKDVITGKGYGYAETHFKYIEDAYNLAIRKGMRIKHVDYMDSVGKDERIQDLFDGLDNVENPDLREILNIMYSHIQSDMSNVSASYDTYLLLSNSREDIFMDDLRLVTSKLARANYRSYKVLNKFELGSLVKVVFGLSDFSVNDVMTKLHTSTLTNYLTVIWKENDEGRVIVNKTSEEKIVEKRVLEKEKGVRKKGKKVKSKKVEEEIDLF